MSVTQIKGRVYRHDQTGFVVHHVHSVADLVTANGVLFEGPAGWQWMAGRDMLDFLRVEQATTLTAACLAARPLHIATRAIVGGANSACHSGWTKDVPLPSAQNPTTQSYTTVFAVYNALDAGFGQSSHISPEKGNPATSIISFGTQTDSGGTGMMDPATRFQNMGSFGMYWPQDTSNILGTGTVVVPLGCSWNAQMDAFFGALPNADKDEVKQRATAAKTLVQAILRARGIDPASTSYFTVPIVICKDGTRRYLPAKPAQFATMQNVSGGMITPYDGARGYFASGRGAMVPFVPKQSVNATMKAVAFSDLPGISSIDGVRIDRVLGGLASGVLLDTGYSAPNDSAPKTVAQLFAEYKTAWYWGDTSAPTQPMGPSGLPATNQEWATQAQQQYAGIHANDFSTGGMSNWDSHGFRLGTLVAYCSAAMDPGTANGPSIYALDPVAFPCPPVSAGSNPGSLDWYSQSITPSVPTALMGNVFHTN